MLRVKEQVKVKGLGSNLKIKQQLLEYEYPIYEWQNLQLTNQQSQDGIDTFGFGGETNGSSYFNILYSSGYNILYGRMINVPGLKSNIVRLATLNPSTQEFTSTDITLPNELYIGFYGFEGCVHFQNDIIIFCNTKVNTTLKLWYYSKNDSNNWIQYDYYEFTNILIDNDMTDSQSDSTNTISMSNEFVIVSFKNKVYVISKYDHTILHEFNVSILGNTFKGVSIDPISNDIFVIETYSNNSDNMRVYVYKNGTWGQNYTVIGSDNTYRFASCDILNRTIVFAKYKNGNEEVYIYKRGLNDSTYTQFDEPIQMNNIPSWGQIVLKLNYDVLAIGFLYYSVLLYRIDNSSTLIKTINPQNLPSYTVTNSRRTRLGLIHSGGGELVYDSNHAIHFLNDMLMLWTSSGNPWIYYYHLYNT